MRVVVDNGPGKGRRPLAAKRGRPATPATTLRAATAADAPALHALIAAHLEEGRLLPRTLGELADHAHRFVVATRDDAIVGCAELAPLSRAVAEVRSLVVSRDARQSGLGYRMVDELGRRARREGFARLTAFAHDPRFFVRLGFAIVPHTWVPEKIAHDCHSCPLFRNCGQYAIVLDLERAQAQSRANARAAAGVGRG
ncbi:MAG: GNAT family N-acetyltransferase [Acidobacteriota bacterium]|nr:GNAT family N-acetyltransferase [Acidobacteriota bacterium]